MRPTSVVLLASLALLTHSVAEASIWHVSVHGDDATGDGTSSAPFATIARGLEASFINGDSVLVGPGVYTGTSNTHLPFDGESVTLLGTAGASLTTIDAAGVPFRLWATHQSWTGEPVRLQSLTIANAEYVNIQAPNLELISCLFEGHGGRHTKNALSCQGDLTLLVEDCVFRGIYAMDTGINLSGNEVTISSTEFRNSNAQQWAVRVSGDTATLVSCLFDALGQARSLVVSTSQSTVTNCRFTNLDSRGEFYGNTTIQGCSFDSCWGHLNYGEAIVTALGTMLVSSCSFTANEVTCLSALGEVVVEDTVFVDNVITYWLGGAVVTMGGEIELHRCRFQGNAGGEGPSAIAVIEGVASLNTCVLSGNQSAGSSADGGSVVTVVRGDLIVGSSTFAHNTTEYGAQIVTTGDGPASSITVSNTIIAFGSETAFQREGTTPNPSISISATDIFGNAGGDWTPLIADQLADLSNFSLDPQFCSLDENGFFVSATSPCLPGNHPSGQEFGLIGARGEGCGVVGTQSVSWGDLKSRFGPDD